MINDPRLIQRAEIIREKGTDRSRFFRGEVDKYTWQDIGSSFLPSELTSAFLWAQLEEADRINAKRYQVFFRYIKGLHPLVQAGYIRIPEESKECVTNGHLCYILTASLEERIALINHLRRAGINTVFHYILLHSSPAGSRICRTHGDMPITDNISACSLRLPLFYGMTEDDVNEVVESVTDFYNL